MDALKGFAEKAMKSGGGGGQQHTNTNTNTNPAGQGAAQGAQQDDYVDKGVSMLGKKFAPNVSREQQEKYTDMAREQYEKQTGSKVDPKYSN